MKWSLGSAAAAFVLAFIVSLLLGHTTLLVALFRAVIFAALFFGLGAGVRALISTFLPELLSSGGDEDAVGNVFSPGSSGSQVNITVDDAPSAALPEANDDALSGGDEVGNFNDLIAGSITGSKDIDQSPPTSYTEEVEEAAPVFGNVKLEETGGFSMDFGAFVSDGLEGGGLEDLDTFSFLPDGGGGGPGKPEGGVSAPAAERKVSGNKPLKLEGDFDAKEIAAGLRTVLEKEKKKG